MQNISKRAEGILICFISERTSIPILFKEVYFEERTETSATGGQLFHKYNNSLKRARKANLVPPKRRNIKSAETAEAVEPSRGAHVSEDYNEEDAHFLKYNQGPWAEIELRWKRSASFRKNKIAQSTEKNISSILIDWPLIRHAHGYNLVKILIIYFQHRIIYISFSFFFID